MAVKISPRIPIILTKKDGTQQTYWTTLENFMKARERGMPIQRIPRKEHKSVRTPDEKAPVYEMEFIENLMDFNVAALEIGEDKFEAELICEVRLKKNGKHITTYPVKVNKEKIARAVLSKIMGSK